MDAARLMPWLAERFGPDRLLTEPGQLAPYESDALTAFAVTPRAVVLVQSADEVIDTVRICRDTAVPFVARGSGTSLSGGSVPVEGGIVIALNRLNRVLKLDPDQRIAVVEPGVTNNAVTDAAQPFGLFYAPDPSSQQICTIGGNVAFNSGGAHCLKYGMTSNHVLAIKAVLADGDIVEMGSDSLESVGPDAVGLFVGHEGLFGIALEITLRLVPRPEAYHTVLIGYRSTAEAGDAVAKIIATGLLPGALEIMDRLALDAAEASVNADFPPGAQAVLIVELEGAHEQVAVERQQLTQIIDQTNPTQVNVAADAAQRLAIWKGRKCAFSAVGQLSPDYIVQDGVVPRSRLGEALQRIEELADAHQLRCANVFHAGDGNLHPLILYDGRQSGAMHRAEQLAAEILTMCIEMNGSVTGEHGIGVEKREFLPRMFSEHDMTVMRRLHHAMDPAGVANTGKMLLPEPAEQSAAAMQSA